jgi:DNA-binding protein YbaB
MYDDTIHDKKQESFVKDALKQINVRGALMNSLNPNPTETIESLIVKAINIGYNHANSGGAESIEELISKFKDGVKSFNPNAKVTVRLEY